MDISAKQDVRLSKDIVPNEYDICLEPDLTELVFTGSVKILISVKSATNQFSLHGVDIDIKSAKLEDIAKQTTSTPSVSHSPSVEKIDFNFDNPLQPGDYSLSIAYTGSLGDKLRGFYRNKYVTPSGDIRYAAVTHFEATGARHAYPCFDEPSFKAKFKVTIIAPKDRVALSNMPVESEEECQDNPQKKKVSFQTTPIMSTYLTAFVVGEYDFVESVMDNGTKVRVYTPLGKRENGRFALEVATKALAYFEDYFGVPYGLPKLDLISLTEFAIGAMENWGLITFRETALLVDQEKSSTVVRQHVSLIVTHEVSHCWFGNLVTMNWWSDLWLKEGFATWIEYQCTNFIFPEFNIWSTFVKREQAVALKLDALENSHPIEVPVDDPGQIDEIFDAISYSKGACLIRMLQKYIGDEAFQRGMHLYLTRHAFTNTDTKDMWTAMEESSGKEVAKLMDAWTTQKGFPLLKVEESVQPNSGQRKVTLIQTKFSATGTKVESSQTTWPIPYSITTASSPNQPVAEGLMQEQSLELTIDCPAGDWIKVNPGQYMSYHVQYQPESLHRLVPAIEGQLLGTLDRIGLVTDLWALSKANCIRLVNFLDLIKSFKGETDFAVVGSLVAVLGQMMPLIHASYQEKSESVGSVQDFKALVCRVFRPMLDFIGWDEKPGEAPTAKMLRAEVLHQLGSCGDDDVKQEAFRRIQDHFNGKQILPTDIRTPIYETNMIHGDRDVYRQLKGVYSKEESQEEKIRILRVLGLTPCKDHLDDLLKFSLSEQVRNQDTVYVLPSVVSSFTGMEMACEFMKTNWAELHRRYGTSTLISSIVSISLSNLYTDEHRKDMEEFFKSHATAGAEAAVKQGLERMQSNQNFLRSQKEEIVNYLNQQSAAK